ncbi:NAD(P)-dependent oxidoreductase [Alsobacter metallidurans]|uniref:NAD(P)-dependent oxidoreductase n=1 Tax=Alsobacter metallidurans TaxID=340221 RepID=A0A917MJN4_9HYPH|nr:SDR family oxidoreductase [Alsobacter metallidurans]GGH27915.1 NAD(P)-dependent oxidoreductase [Alsobacter metallidurans]
MTAPDLLKGKTALVTGATSGIGEALSRRLAGRGAHVILLAPDPARVARLADELGASATALPLDLRDHAAVDAVASRIPPAVRAIDVLVNCAGHDMGGDVRFHELDPSALDGIMAVNVLGLMRLTRAILPAMVERGRGDIVNVGSITSRQRSRHLAAYASSKHAVHGFSQSLRADYADTDLRIIEILPGAVKTNFASRRLGGDDARAAAFYERFPVTLSPDDVASAILYALEQPLNVTVSELVVVPTRER